MTSSRNIDDRKEEIRDKSHYDSQFKTLFLTFYSPLCNYALKITGDPEVAEDLVQNMFLQIYQKRVITTVKDPERYLLRGIKYKCIDYIRSKSTKQEINLDSVADSVADFASEISDEEVEPLLHYFAAKLPLKTREVFLLSRESGMTYKEIASELNISVKTVETQMGRALRQMKELLKSHNFISLIPFL
jgi:RNA polymerase sigma-70 factor (ECF subfamily)